MLSSPFADTLIVAFATGSQREYLEAFAAELPATLPRVLVTDASDGPDAAVRLIAAGVRLFDGAARHAGLHPTHDDVPAWGRRVFFLDPK